VYCRTQLGELQQFLPRFGALGAEVWAVSSTDIADRLAAYAKLKGLSFPLLSDAGLGLTRSYGLLDPTNGVMAEPAAIVVDRGGTVRFVRVDVDFRKRPAAQELLDVVRNLNDQ
jgi:peroxiredoxin